MQLKYNFSKASFKYKALVQKYTVNCLMFNFNIKKQIAMKLRMKQA